MIRFLFLAISKKLSELSGENKFVNCLMSCGNCCLGCIEKICDYINTAAFAYMAISGESFCSSAWNCFLLNIKHLAKFAFANYLAKIFIVIGKLAIIALNCYTLNILIKADPETDESTSVIGPMIVVAISTYLTCSIFLNFFD